jgi:hypothetical protein
VILNEVGAEKSRLKNQDCALKELMALGRWKNLTRDNVLKKISRWLLLFS